MVKQLKPASVKILADAPVEFVFYCRDGKIFKNLKELRDGLANMTDETYLYHVNESKNDFARWVGDIIKDNELAAKLASITVVSSGSDAAALVGTRVMALSRKSRSAK